MTEHRTNDLGRPIPGPDYGFCPTCGAWRKAGMLHTCDPKRIEENERFAGWIAWRAMQP